MQVSVATNKKLHVYKESDEESEVKARKKSRKKRIYIILQNTNTELLRNSCVLTSVKFCIFLCFNFFQQKSKSWKMKTRLYVEI
jgi:hypothetical protein